MTTSSPRPAVVTGGRDIYLGTPLDAWEIFQLHLRASTQVAEVCGRFKSKQVLEADGHDSTRPNNSAASANDGGFSTHRGLYRRDDVRHLLGVTDEHSSGAWPGALLCSVSIQELVCDYSAQGSSGLLCTVDEALLLDLLQSECRVREHEIIHLESDYDSQSTNL